MSYFSRPNWFKRKRYDWGWLPVTWHGWAVTMMYAVGVFTLALYLGPNPSVTAAISKLIVPAILLTMLYAYIANRTSLEPHWVKWEDQ